MKILMVSSYLPYPLWDGGRIRLYNILKFLKKDHEVTLVCEKRPNQQSRDEEEIAKVCRKLIVTQRPKVWSFGNISRSLLSTNSLLVTSHTNKKFKKAIKDELNSEKFDLIHVETFYVMQNLPKVDIPVVLTEHNIEFEVYKRYAGKSTFYIKPFLYQDILKLKRQERQSWKKADKLIAVSPHEQKIMGDKVYLVPNGVDTNKFRFKKNEKNNKNKKVLFIGDFKWVQNRDSAVFIIKNIWPRILYENKNKFNLKLWVVGKNIPERIKSLKENSIIFDENAPDQTEQIFKNADILLAPIRIGGGSSFKILEAMSTGVPVITSKLGNEGIGAKDGSEIKVCILPEEYVGATIKLLNDDYLYEKISRNARAFVEENFDWTKIVKKLEDVYRSAVSK